MKRRLLIIFLFILLNSFSFGGFSIDVAKVLKFVSKISNQMSLYSENIEKHYEEFKEYYNKYWKNFYRKFFKKEFDLLKSNSTYFTLSRPYIDIENSNEI